MRQLRRLGFGVSVGVVNVADSDQFEAQALDLPRVEEAPFSPITDEMHERNCELARAADVIVVTAIPLGRGNLRNLEAAIAARAGGRRVLLIDDPTIGTRDFADGEATALQKQLVQAGAELCPSNAAALAEVENLP
jgi:iron complex transport system ATP-binding protein